jgi:hypothetical protein
VLDGDAAAERGDAVDVALADRLGMVEEPVEVAERLVAVDALVHVERAADGLVVGGVQPPRPAVLDQQPDHRFQLALHLGAKLGRGSLKSSKSAAENTSISPAPLWR